MIPYFSLEWRQIQTPLILFGIICLAGVGWWYWAYQYKEQMLVQQKNQRNEYDKINKLLEETEKTVAVIQQSYQLFQKFKKKGFLSKTHRLSWRTEMSRLEKKYQIPYFNFNFSERRHFTLPSTITLDSDFTLYVSEMTLEMEVLHEGIWLNILQELEQPQFAGIHRTQQCSAAYLGQTNKPSNEANLRVSCQIQWYIASIEESTINSSK